jgi:DNA gyrase/topoisomerase IV subunit A
MMNSTEAMLADIDETLDQLIKNAEAIQDISLNTLYANEVEALQKTQESLLAHLVHMDTLMKSEKPISEKKKEGLQEKISRFGRLNASFVRDVATRFSEERELVKIRLPRRK